MMLTMEGRRKRTSSLGSHTTDTSHRQDSDGSSAIGGGGLDDELDDDSGIAFPTLSKTMAGGLHHHHHPHHHAATAWGGQRSGSAPPERSHRTTTTSSSSNSNSNSNSNDDDRVTTSSFTTTATTAHSVSEGSSNKSTDTSLASDEATSAMAMPASAAGAQSSTSDVHHHHHHHGQGGGGAGAGGPNGAGIAAAEGLVDQLLLDGLKVPKDRLLLLRSEMEMDKSIHDASRHRLRVAPPGFPPNLNSYQRLLVHRLADLWTITRELEPASNAAALAHHPAPAAGSMITGTIVLVKNEATKAPVIRLSSLVPPEPLEVTAASLQMVSLASKVASVSLDQQSPQTIHKTAPHTSNMSPAQAKIDAIVAGTPLPVVQKSPILAAQASLPSSSSSAAASTSASASTSSSPAPSAGPVRIMSRASQNGTSRSNKVSPSPSLSGGTQGMTFEEREAAYQQARMRIFNASQQQKQSSPTVSTDARASSSSMTGAGSLLNNANYTMQYSPEQARFMQQHFQSGLSHPVDGQGPSGPSAPIFVYQTMPGPPLSYQGQPDQQAFAYQAMGGPNVQASMPGPPIQVTVPSPAPFHMQHHPHMVQQPIPQHYMQQGQQPQQQQAAPFGTFQHISQAMPGPSNIHYRPTSAHSHSSQSSLSTTTSASSIRTASTSSAQRSTLSVGRGYVSPGESLRSMRQGAQLGPALRQMRSGTRPTGNLSSAASNSSVQSRQSISSTSTSPSLAEDSRTSTRLPSSRTSDSNFSSPERELSVRDKHRTSAPLNHANLTGPRASLPVRPDWVGDDTGSSGQTVSSSASSVSSVSSGRRAQELIDDPAPVSREDAHTPLSSTSGRASAKNSVDDKSINLNDTSDFASVTEDESADARSTPLSLPASLPPEAAALSTPSSSVAIKKMTSSGQEVAVSANVNKTLQKKGQSSQTKPIEYPPLRYDKVKGWTAMAPGDTAGTTTGHQVADGSGSSRSGGSMGKHVSSSSAGNRSSSGFQQWPASPSHHHPIPSQHHQSRSLSQQSNNGLQHVQHLPANGYGTSPQYIMMQVPAPAPGISPGPHAFTPQQHFPVRAPGHYFDPTHGGSPQYSVSHNPALLPAHSLGNNEAMHSMPGQFIPHVYYQQAPLQHVPQQMPQGYTYVSQGAAVPHQGGMTASDMLANGEMLYSYDLPRPVPRSGATLFDPNARP